jgi:hypothetical protein
MRKQSRTSKATQDAAGRQKPAAGTAAPDPRLIAIARALGRLLAREDARANKGSPIPDRHPRRP